MVLTVPEYHIPALAIVGHRLVPLLGHEGLGEARFELVSRQVSGFCGTPGQEGLLQPHRRWRTEEGTDRVRSPKPRSALGSRWSGPGAQLPLLQNWALV